MGFGGRATLLGLGLTIVDGEGIGVGSVRHASSMGVSLRRSTNSALFIL